MSLNTGFPSRCQTENHREVVALLTGTGATAPTKTFGRGIQSISRTSAGLYVITFTNVGAKGPLLSFGVLNTAGTTAAQKVVNATAYSAANRTLTILVTDVATPTAVDLAVGDQLTVHVGWFETDANV